MKTVMIASIPDREDMLRKTVESLRGQCDKIRVALNDYDHVPDFLNRGEFIILNNEKGDAGKFYFADKLTGYLLSGDDDLIYPENYVEYMISGVDRYRSACTLHGKTYNRPVVNFGQTLCTYQCLSDVIGDGKIDVGGTGVMAWHSDFLKVSYANFKSKNMADLWFSKLCWEQGVKIMCLDHKKGNLKYQGPVTTIWRQEKEKGFKEQTELLKTFII
jgi:hypothetical protein